MSTGETRGGTSSTRHARVAVIIIAAALVAADAAPARAAGVVWGPPVTVGGDADVSNVGTTVLAVNLAGGAPTINGVSFVAGGASGSGYLFTTPVGSISATTTQFGSSAAPFNGLSTGYANVLESGIFTHTPPAAPPPMTLTLTGLTPGQVYAFQWWVNDSRMTGDETRVTTATAGTTVTLEHNVQNTAGGVGQFAIGTFLADAASQQIVFQGAGGGPNVASTQVNAFQLRLVPEPAGAAVAAAALGLLAVPRRPRRRETAQ